MALNFTDLAAGSVIGYGLWDQLDRYDDIAEGIGEGFGDLSNQIIEGTQFTPFSVSGYGGGADVSSTGDINVNLDPTQQAQAQNLTGYADNLFASAAGDQMGRVGDAYDRIRATQRPEEERQFLNLEGRLQAQGRAGLASDAYGGSPEMFGFEKARGEAMNSASLAALSEARAQQNQDAMIGTQFQSNAYMPQAQMLNLLNPGLQAAGLSQAGQMAGMNSAAQLGSEAMRGQINAEKIRADLMNNLFQTAGGVIGAQGSAAGGDPLKDAFNWGWDNLFGDGGFFGG